MNNEILRANRCSSCCVIIRHIIRHPPAPPKVRKAASKRGSPVLDTRNLVFFLWKPNRPSADCPPKSVVRAGWQPASQSSQPASEPASQPSSQSKSTQRKPLGQPFSSAASAASQSSQPVNAAARELLVCNPGSRCHLLLKEL